MTVGVVLGAGGPLGWAYHLGVLQGVRDAIGREPANADRIVGTSAGAAIAATLLTGTSSGDVLEMISSPPSDNDRDQMRAVRDQVLRNPLRALRPVAPGLIRNIGEAGVATAMVGMLPSGLFPTIFLRRFAADVPWPSQLWVPSVRLDDGCVVVFGRDPIVATLGDAIEATSAVPAVFQPKTIDGARYVDGAVASSTHADTLVPEGHAIVLISAPTARPGRGFIRSRARHMLNTEVTALQDARARTIVLIPNEEVLAAADGFPRRSDGGANIVDAARRQTIAAFTNARTP